MTAENFNVHWESAALRAAAARPYARIEHHLSRCHPSSAGIRQLGAAAIPGCSAIVDLDIVVRVPAAALVRACAALNQPYECKFRKLPSQSFAASNAAAATLSRSVQRTTIDSPHGACHHATTTSIANPKAVTNQCATKRSINCRWMD